MAASELDIWRYAVNIIQRNDYGENGKKHFKLQKERAENMSKGGDGGVPGNSIMIDTSDHEGTIRQMHFVDWEDGDFKKALEFIERWEAKGKLPTKPAVVSLSLLENAVERAYDSFQALSRNDQVTALNALAEKLGVMGEEEGETE